MRNNTSFSARLVKGFRNMQFFFLFFLLVDTFSPKDIGRFPSGWKPRKNEGRKIYKVVLDGKNPVLFCSVKSLAIPIAKKFKFDPKRYPILKWRWKVVSLPVGGDERYKSKGDSAAGVYVIFPGGFLSVLPKCLKYVWSASDLPRGFMTESPYSKKTKVIILENRKSPLGVWIDEKVNIYTDYIKYFGKKPKIAKGIGIMSDSDNTKSLSVAYYDNIILEEENEKDRGTDRRR